MTLNPETVSRLQYLLCRSFYTAAENLREYYRLGYKEAAELAVQHIEELHVALRDTGFSLTPLDMLDGDTRAAYASVLANLDD